MASTSAESATAPRRPSEARDRLLRTASMLFYAKGVHAVGVDEILSTAQVTRATLYRHFPSKDDLIVHYISTADQGIRDALAQDVADSASDDPAAEVRAITRFVAGQIRTPGFRGCAFLNAAAEYPDPTDPIHHAVQIHRAWFHGRVLAAFQQINADRAPQAADHFVMLRDGAMVEGCLVDPEIVTATFQHGINGMLASLEHDER